MRNVIAIFFTSLLLFSCQKELDDSNELIPEKTALNVSYGSDGLQKMDVYLPANRSAATTKVIILIHGGGWIQDDKSVFGPYIDTLKKRLPGYAIFNINYRLATSPATIFPAQENDVKAALDFIFSKRTEYGVSDKFVLLGQSAGAHLSLLQAYKYTTPVPVKAVVDFFGPTELADMYNNPPNPLVPGLLTQVTGGTPLSHAAVYQQSSPLNFATLQSPPTIILHGGADIVVSPAQSVLLRDKLQTLGVANQYVFYPAENHGWFGSSLTDSFDKIAAFLAIHVR